MTLRHLLLLAPLSMIACGGGSSTNDVGDQGKLTFQIEQPDCLLLCGTSSNTPALAGSIVVVEVTNGDTASSYTAGVEPAGAADAALDTECTCTTSAQTIDTGGTSRSVSLAASCNPGETKSCTRFVTLQTKSEGDLQLRIERGGEVVDQHVLHLVAAARVDSALTTTSGAALTAGSDGVYTVPVGAPVNIASTAYDGSGNKLLYTRDAFHFAYADKSIVAPDPALVGSSGVENAIAVSRGSTKVTVTADGNAPHDIALRVQ